MAGKKKPGIPVKGINIKLRMIDDLIDVTGSAKDSWNPAEISDDMKAIAYIHDLADTWNPAQLNEALKYLGFATIDSWNPAIIEETKNKLVKYFLPTNASGNPIELDLKGSLPYEVTALTIDILPIQDLSQGEPSPTNVCPISGRTQASVTRTGKNLLPITATTAVVGNVTCTVLKDSDNKIIEINLDGTANTNGYFIINSSITLKAGTYAINGCPSGGSGNSYYLYFYNSASSDFGNGATVTFDSETTITNTRIVFSSGQVFSNKKFYPMIRPSVFTDDTYEPYNGETVTVQFGQTVYGGTVNVLEGGTSSTYGYIASYDGEELPGAWISDRDVYVAGTAPTTGAEVVYVLTTPTELTTPANEIALVNGENTLSTNGDTINITYKAILNS